VQAINPTQLTPSPSTSDSPQRDAAPSDATLASPVRQECRSTHVKRRSHDDECCICLNLMTNTPRSQLVWCKSQCGQNFHRECIGLWQEHCRDGYTCVNWYVKLLRDCHSEPVD
jgi:hypothetical protein